MSVGLLERNAAIATGLGIVDCDIHPAGKSPGEIGAFLPERWRQHMAEYGARSSQPFVDALPYPRMAPDGGARMDAWPPSGGPPASDLDFMREQLLDLHRIEHGMLQPLLAGAGALNHDLAAALCAASNDWQLERWVRAEPRLKGAICIAQEDADAAVAEITKRADDRGFAQIAMPPRTIEPHGRKRYWKIYAAAQETGLPIGLHSSAIGSHANSGTGWLGYYIEEHYCFAHSVQSVMTSLVLEGVFEQFPGLKIVLIEGGFAWVPSLAWRLDHAWERMRSEVPHVKRPPSEYIREHFWYTTQPVVEPERPRDLLDIIRWIGHDRLLFSTDYPHWDFDDPRVAFKVKLPEEWQRGIFGDNARALYRLP